MTVQIGDVYRQGGGGGVVVVNVVGEKASCVQRFTGRHTWVQLRRLEREYDKAGEIRTARAKRVLAATMRANAEEKNRRTAAARKGGAK